MTGDEQATAMQIVEKLSRELDEDYVGLWKVPWHIRRAWPDASDDQVRALAASILTALSTIDVHLGDLNAETGEFWPWPAGNSIEAAIEAWVCLGRDPNIGEVAWLARLS